MKAILLHEHGNVDVLKYSDFPEPTLAPGHVMVKLHAAALNHMDIFVRKGWPGLKLDYPHILGADGAGEVVSFADDVTGWISGDRVAINANLGCGICEFCLKNQDNLCINWHLLGETIRGTYAEYISLPSCQLYKLPADISFETAAASGLVFHTAWHSLITKGQLKPEETVLIIGASGGINTASIQIVKYMGARSIVVGSTPEKLELAESLGADELILGSQDEQWEKIVFKLTEKRGVDVVVDNVGTTFPQSFRTLKKGGRLLTVGNTANPKFEIDNRFIFGKHLTIIGSTMGTLSDFTEVMDLISLHKLHPAISKTYPLNAVKAAHSHLESRRNFGKVVLSI